MRRCFQGLWAVWALGLPLQAAGQSGTLTDTIWLRLTTHWDSASVQRERGQALQLAPAEPGTRFATAWLTGIQRAKGGVYADAARQQALTRATLRRQLKPYRAWLRKTIRYATPADDPTNFYFAVDQQEVWQPGQPPQVIGQRVTLNRWDSAAPPLLTWHLPPRHPALYQALPYIRVYRDYRADHDASLQVALDQHHLNDQALTPVRFQPAMREAPVGLASRRVRIRIPSQLSASNSLIHEPVDRAQRQASAWLVAGTAQVLLRPVLLRQLPSYYFNVRRKLPRDQVALFIRQHDLIPGDPTRRKDARTQDYTFGVEELQVTGLLTRTASGQVQFRAEDVELLWRDDSLNVPVTGLGLIDLADAERLNLQVQGRPLREALSDLATLYWYLIQVNDYSPLSLPASFDLRRRLWSGDWASLPNHAAHEAWVGLNH